MFDKKFSSSLLIGVFIPMLALAAPATQTTAPTSQPAPAALRISLDVDNVSASQAVDKFAQATNIPFKWQGNRSGAKVTIHATDKPLLDVLADLCMQGHCVPRNFGPGNIVFRGNSAPPVFVVRPNDLSLLLCSSVQCQDRIDVANPSSHNEYINFDATAIFDPAAQIASVRTLDIDRVQAEDGTFYRNSGSGWGQQPATHMDTFTTWELHGQINIPAYLGKKINVFGHIHAYTLTNFAQLQIDDPRTIGKTFGNDELKCTVKSADTDSIALLLQGSLIQAYGFQRLQGVISNATVKPLDDSDLPVEYRSDISAQGADAVLTVRSPVKDGWKDTGPASINLQLPRAARQIEIPVEIRDLVIR